MPRTKTLVIVLAGGAGGRLRGLTEGRAKPAVPFGGTHRLIDFPLSNAHNSGLTDVWVVQQYNPMSLSDHLANGRPWDLDRTQGGLMLLHPRLGEGGGWHTGTADSLWRNAGLIREFAPDHLVVLSADAVYLMDYAAVLDEHRDADADITMVTTEVDLDDAGRYGVVQADDDGRITDYAYKPDEPVGNVVATEVFVMNSAPILDLLEELGRDADEEEGLGDLGDDLLPRLADEGRARASRFDRYWRDVGTVGAYWEAHMDLLKNPPPIDLDDAAWPLFTRGGRRPAARLLRGADVRDAMVAAAATVGGTVEHAVLGTGVVVEEGAVVRDAVLLDGVQVRRGATVQRAVVDEQVEVGADAVIGKPDGDPDDVTLVGRGRRVPPGERLWGDEAEQPAERDD